jgi:ADP-heptose:LPS heptosyltransferase
MKKSRRQKGLLGTMAGMIGRKRQTALLTAMSAKQLRTHIIRMPYDVQHIQKALFIFPESPLDALYQVENVTSLMGHFNGADVTFFCEHDVAAYFKKMPGVTSVFSYEKSERYLFSREFSTMCTMMAREEFDIVCLLERRPDPALLSLVAASRAGIRVGYSGAAEFPILNVRIGSPGIKTHLAERNIQMAAVLGARRTGRIRWSVSKNTLEEVRIMLQEAKLLQQPFRGGIDIGLFSREFGREWTSALIEALHQTSINWYLYAENADAAMWARDIETLTLPVFAGLSPSKLAALIRLSSVIISGKSVMFELASLLKRPAAGIFEESVCASHCRCDQTSAGISYIGSPDVQTIEQTVAAVGAMVQNGVVAPAS